MKLRTRDMTLIAVMAALLCVAGPLTISIGPVPLSLATFVIYLAGATLGVRRGLAAVAVYLLIGLVGVPVFSGFSGGIQKLAGPTGGYLAGYLICAAITGLSAKGNGAAPKWKLPAFMALGTAALYSLGTLWFMGLSGMRLSEALLLCVTPFLPGDAIKIVAASLVTPPIRRAINRT